MSALNLLAAALIALALIYVLNALWTKLSHTRRARQLQCVPAPIRPYTLPLGLDIFRCYMRAASTHNAQNDDMAIYNELGQTATWNQNLLGFWQHYTADPKNIQAILATQFKDFELGPVRRGVFEPLIGRGIFTSDGHEWERSRALLRPQFARNQVSDLNMIEAHVQNLFQRLDAGDGTADLAPLFFNLTLDSATEFLFGQSALSQLVLRRTDQAATSGTLDWSNFGAHFDAANTIVTLRSRLLDLYFLYNPRSFQNDCKEVHKYVDRVVNEALQRHNKPLEKKQEEEGRYVFLTELLKATQNPHELRSQLLNILLAGRDTTAGLLGWTFYYLARNPLVYTKLRAAVLETFGTTRDAITFETLKSCAYLQNVLRETLRLEPVVPENSRRATRNTTLPVGGGPQGTSPIYIRRGEEVTYNVFIMQRRKDIWGEDADEFRPERWEERRKVGWEFLPFNGGPRICLGQQFALTEAGYVVVRMVQRFESVEGLGIGGGETLRRFTATTSPVEVKVRLSEGGKGVE